MAASEEALIKWTPEMEVALFKALIDHKPIGIHKHWHMLCVHHKMITQGGVVIPVSEIWSHLQTLYDLVALEDTEPMSVVEEEFYLPAPFYEEPSQPRKKRSTSVTSEDQLPRKRQRTSSSPSPAASPLSVTKRKRTQQ